MADINEKIREEFESYCKEQLIHPRDIYFQMWHASRACMQVKLPESGHWMGWGNDELMRADDVRESMKVAGLKVTP